MWLYHIYIINSSRLNRRHYWLLWSYFTNIARRKKKVYMMITLGNLSFNIRKQTVNLSSTIMSRRVLCSKQHEHGMCYNCGLCFRNKQFSVVIQQLQTTNKKENKSNDETSAGLASADNITSTGISIPSWILVYKYSVVSATALWFVSTRGWRERGSGSDFPYNEKKYKFSNTVYSS